MSKVQYTYITKDGSVTVYVKGNAQTAIASHPNYDKIIKAVKEGLPEDDMLKLFNTKEAITEYCGKEIEIKDGVLFYRGKELRNSLTTKILRMMDEQFNIEPMTKFLTNLRQNPSKTAQEELMLFMEANEMPLTPDGYFLSYKAVNDDFLDYHSRTFSNKIGDICEMDRLDVDDNRQKTCSNGLHIGAKNYAGGFGGSGHLMIVKVNPRDVVSIPYDYNNMKGRVCRYEVIGEVPKQKDGKDAYNQTAVYDDAQWKCKICGCTDTYIDDFTDEERCADCDSLV